MTSKPLIPEGEVIGPNCVWVIRSDLIWVRISWDNYHAHNCTYGIKGISKFSPYHIMVRSQYWPDLRSPNTKSIDIRFVGTDAHIKFWKFYINLLKSLKICSRSTIANVLQVRSFDLLRWPDLTCPNHLLPKCVQWMLGKICKVWTPHFQVFNNGTGDYHVGL